MRGQSIPAGMMIAPSVHGWTAEGDKRPPVDVDGAKKLLGEPAIRRLRVTMDCPNNRYVNDEEICQAVASMWAKIGIKAKLNAMPFATYIPKILKNDTSIYMLGWGVSTFDALYSLQALQRTVDPKGGADGSYNLGRYSNAKVDALIDQIKVETDQAKREAQIPRRLQALHGRRRVPADPPPDPAVGDEEERDDRASRRRPAGSEVDQD
jgi:peptide/nickel transport system substrate-binding protein